MEIATNTARSLFILYLIIATHYAAPLFGCRIHNILTKNMYIRHILAFSILYVFVSLLDTQITTKQRILVSFLVYFCFMLSSKLNEGPWIAFMALIGSSFVLYLLSDGIVNETYKEYILNLQILLMVSAFILLVVGFVLFMREKQLEYGPDFSYKTFFFHEPHCTNTKLIDH